MSPRPLILVADDDENDLRMTVDALARSGAAPDVRTVHDGAEALDYLHGRGEFKDRPTGLPALLLLDLKMPRIDGWEVLRRLKGDPVLKSIPVVIFTSSSRDHDVGHCYELGANAYVVKPIDFHEFTAAVRDIRLFWAGRNQPPHPPPGPEGVALPAGAKAGTPS